MSNLNHTAAPGLIVNPAGSEGISATPTPLYYICIPTERTDYVVSESELNSLAEGGANCSKDFFFACLGVGLPCVINAIAEIRGMEKFVPTLSFNINLVVGLVGIVLGISFGFSWRKSFVEITKLKNDIKGRPKMRIG